MTGGVRQAPPPDRRYVFAAYAAGARPVPVNMPGLTLPARG